jgi:hypothetical protein
MAASADGHGRVAAENLLQSLALFVRSRNLGHGHTGPPGSCAAELFSFWFFFILAAQKRKRTKNNILHPPLSLGRESFKACTEVGRYEVSEVRTHPPRNCLMP